MTVCVVTPFANKLLIAVISATPLLRAPAVTPLTVSVIVQVAPPAISTLVAVKGWVALTAVKTGEPQFKLVGAAGFAICNPACNVSVND